MSDHYSRREVRSLVIEHAPSDDISAAFEGFLRWMRARNYSERTIDLRAWNIGEFASWLSENGITELEAITAPMLEEYQGWLSLRRTKAGKPLCIATQARRIETVRMLFRYLLRSGRISTNPALNLEPPREERRLPQPALTQDEVERVLSQPDINTRWGLRDRAVMETMFATGIRRLELVHLKIDDVDFVRGTLRIARGKGNHGRIVPISDRALSWIKRYLQIRPHAARPEDAYILFLTSRRGQMMGAVHLSRTIRAYVEAAGIGKTGSCHIFRSTTATLMLESGADIRFIQEMLGHAYITTTQRYTRVSIGALQKVYAKTHPSAQRPPAAVPPELTTTPERVA